MSWWILWFGFAIVIIGSPIYAPYLLMWREQQKEILELKIKLKEIKKK